MMNNGTPKSNGRFRPWRANVTAVVMIKPQPMARKNPLIGPHDRRDLSISVAVSWSGIGLKRAITETAKHPMILKNSIRRRCNVSLRRMKPAVPVNYFRP